MNLIWFLVRWPGPWAVVLGVRRKGLTCLGGPDVTLCVAYWHAASGTNCAFYHASGASDFGTSISCAASRNDRWLVGQRPSTISLAALRQHGSRAVTQRRKERRGAQRKARQQNSGKPGPSYESFSALAQAFAQTLLDQSLALFSALLCVLCASVLQLLIWLLVKRSTESKDPCLGMQVL